MLLFVNVFVTDKRFFNYKRYNLQANNTRLDIFKYTLASLAVHKFSRAILYIELDQCYSDYWVVFEEFINKIFTCPLELHKRRNSNQHQWQEAISNIEDKVIWVVCNDDHIFIDYNTELVDKAITLLEKEEIDATCYLSHFPELIRTAAGRNPQVIDEDFFAITWQVSDGIQLVTKSTLKNWFSYDLHDKHLGRTDDLQFHVDHMVKCYIPTKEICRHFDGYSHMAEIAHICPPLTIPPGFLDTNTGDYINNLKVLYCSTERREGWININPLNPNFYATNLNGTDYKLLLEDLPCFWNIKEIEEIPHDKNEAIKARNAAKLEMYKCKITRGWNTNMNFYFPDEVFNKWKR